MFFFGSQRNHNSEAVTMIQRGASALVCNLSKFDEKFSCAEKKERPSNNIVKILPKLRHAELGCTNNLAAELNGWFRLIKLQLSGLNRRSLLD